MWSGSTIVWPKPLGLPKEKNHRHVPLNDTLKEELLDLIKQDEVGYDEPVFKSKEGPAKNHDSFIHRFLERHEEVGWGGKSAFMISGTRPQL
jgi:integrase